MREICIDANVIVKLPLKGEPFRAKARALIKECGAKKIVLIAPPLLESEVDSIIAKRVFDGKLSKSEAKMIYTALDKMPVRIQTAPGLRRRARELALQLNQRYVYDCTYAALAELRGCDFWTADRRFHEAAKTVLPFVKFLLDYSGL